SKQVGQSRAAIQAASGASWQVQLHKERAASAKKAFNWLIASRMFERKLPESSCEAFRFRPYGVHQREVSRDSQSLDLCCGNFSQRQPRQDGRTGHEADSQSGLHAGDDGFGRVQI